MEIWTLGPSSQNFPWASSTKIGMCFQRPRVLLRLCVITYKRGEAQVAGKKGEMGSCVAPPIMTLGYRVAACPMIGYHILTIPLAIVSHSLSHLPESKVAFEPHPLILFFIFYFFRRTCHQLAKGETGTS